MPTSDQPGADSLVPCAICGGTETRRLYDKFGYGIERCARCGLVYANPRAPRDVIVARYSRDYLWHEYLPALGVFDGQYDLARFDKRYAPLLELLTEAPGRRLLEVGSGAGFFLKAAERKGWQVTGIELSDEGAQFARERLGLDVRTRQAEALTRDLGQFDAAAMFDTIEHLFDPGAVLRSMADVLAPAGVLADRNAEFRRVEPPAAGHELGGAQPTRTPVLLRRTESGPAAPRLGLRQRQVRAPPRSLDSPGNDKLHLQPHASKRSGTRGGGYRYRVGAHALARAVQRAGRQDILLCVARKRANPEP